MPWCCRAHCWKSSSSPPRKFRRQRRSSGKRRSASPLRAALKGRSSACDAKAGGVIKKGGSQDPPFPLVPLLELPSQNSPALKLKSETGVVEAAIDAVGRNAQRRADDVRAILQRAGIARHNADRLRALVEQIVGAERDRPGFQIVVVDFQIGDRG